MDEHSNPLTTVHGPKPELPSAYWQAQQLAALGHVREARAAYQALAGGALDERLRCLVQNDLAVLLALERREPEAQELFAAAAQAGLIGELATQNIAVLHYGAGESRASAAMADRCRVAIVSIIFNWPSTGGGNVHTIKLALALQAAGYKVGHFYVQYEPWRVGNVDANPFPSEGITFSQNDWTLENVQQRMAAAVDQFSPAAVLITDCWNLKPWIAEALCRYRYILRFDALECICPLNNLRLIPVGPGQLQPCHRSRLATPRECMACVESYWQKIGPRHGLERAFSRFDQPDYQQRLLAALSSAEAVFVHNPLIAATLQDHCEQVRVVPIGVEQEFTAVPPLVASRPAPVRLLFAGRPHDAVKGFEILRQACRGLWTRRQDFRLIVTADQFRESDEFMDWIGWQRHEAMPGVLAETDILVAPSLADEPFGISVLEAMAAGRPVLATRVGGQQFTVLEGRTGLLCRAGSVADLASKLVQLLDDPHKRCALGSAARQRAVDEFLWPKIINRHYTPVLSAISGRARITTALVGQ